MRRLAFFFFQFLNFTIFRLPLSLLYSFADFIYLFLTYIVGYRKEIIQENFKRSFPELSNTEIVKLRKQYLHYMSDLIIETIKAGHFTPKQIQKRIYCTNPEVLNTYYEEKKSVLVMLGHTGNWEWAGLVASFLFKHNIRSVYQIQSNPYFDAFIRKNRQRFGAELIPSKQALRKIISHKDDASVFFLLADQSPAQHETGIWTNFLNQNSAFSTSIEKIAMQLDIPVIFAKLVFVKRGYYRVEFEEIASTPKETQPGEITLRFAELLENQIKTQPVFWLWSHRRWKRKPPVA